MLPAAPALPTTTPPATACLVGPIIGFVSMLEAQSVYATRLPRGLLRRATRPLKSTSLGPCLRSLLTHLDNFTTVVTCVEFKRTRCSPSRGKPFVANAALPLPTSAPFLPVPVPVSTWSFVSPTYLHLLIIARPISSQPAACCLSFLLAYYVLGSRPLLLGVRQRASLKLCASAAEMMPLAVYLRRH